MKTSAFVAVVIAFVTIQGVKSQGTSNSTTVATPTCNEVMCMDGCERVMGSDGCPFCECQTNCTDINCTKDEDCVMKQIECNRDPCFPRPTCVPRFVLCSGTPNTTICGDFNDTQYRWSFNASTHSCQSFRYYGCTPSPNTFTSREECQDKCKSSNVCEVCGDDCYRFKKDQATQCICPDPCKDFNCTAAGEVCRLVDAACDKEPCNEPPKPFCVKDPCPKSEPCDLKCMKSFKRDDNGCQLCSCCDQYDPIIDREEWGKLLSLPLVSDPQK